MLTFLCKNGFTDIVEAGSGVKEPYVRVLLIGFHTLLNLHMYFVRLFGKECHCGDVFWKGHSSAFIADKGVPTLVFIAALSYTVKKEVSVVSPLDFTALFKPY